MKKSTDKVKVLDFEQKKEGCCHCPQETVLKVSDHLNFCTYNPKIITNW